MTAEFVIAESDDYWYQWKPKLIISVYLIGV
jgi:hypothetical protein